jgi:phosphoglycolate phosphatase
MMLAVVSSNSKENVHQILGQEAAALITHYECGTSMFGKEAKLRKVMKKTGALPDESIYIADETRDMEAARKLNIGFGAVSWGYNRAASFKAGSPELVFDTVDDIAEKII